MRQWSRSLVHTNIACTDRQQSKRHYAVRGPFVVIVNTFAGPKKGSAASGMLHEPDIRQRKEVGPAVVDMAQG